jgi:predicted SnoaL-like aldol condensation-catalyzing enzyme
MLPSSLRAALIAAFALTAVACATQPSPAASGPAPAPEPGSVAVTDPTVSGSTSTETAVADPPAATIPSADALDALAQAALEEHNAAIVTAFYDLAFNEHRVAEAFDRYGGDIYVQHSPGLPDGRAAVEAALTPYFRDNPLARAEIRRVITHGDLVVLHVHAKTDPIDRGRAVVEIFRVLDGRIVEHWDVIQTIPSGAANENTMF